jgi:hypothetical protein
LKQEKREEVSLNRTYIMTRFDDNGELEGYHKEKQFIIPVNSEVRFFLDCGSKIATNATLLVNKPFHNSKTGELEYTITQPLKNEESDDDLTFEGSSLSTTHLESYEPDTSISVYSVVFKVPFTEAGSFFVQLAYHDPANPSGDLFTKPMYINVDPRMSLNGRQL